MVNILILDTVIAMGQLESSYIKLGAGQGKKMEKGEEEGEGRREPETKKESKRQEDRKDKRQRKEGLFSSISWKGRRCADNQTTDWPAWYHGWCRKTEVEQKLKEGPQGLFIVKNSTEFPGDLTLCVAYRGEVLYFRVRREGSSYTIDNKELFKDVRNILLQCLFLL